MKLFKFFVISAFVSLSALLLASCSDELGIDNRDTDYGYVQFKLYKMASHTPQAASLDVRASKPELDYLAEATKVKVTLLYGDQTISQTLNLSAADNATAEYGLRSDKLRLLSGDYKVVTFALFDLADEQIYIGSSNETTITIVAGGLSSHDLTANVVPRGKVRFFATKNIATENRPEMGTRANVTRQYTFDEVRKMDIIVRHEATNTVTKFMGLKTKFAIHFDKENDQNNTPGYQTSSLTCDSLLSLPAGLYTVRAYNTYDKNNTLLEECKDLTEKTFTIEDNKTTDAEVKVALYESDEYIKDGYALYEIWKALDGPSWSYYGQNFPKGVNWDFNKDTDLWCYQPGVEVHSNGRIAKIVVSDYGFGGYIPSQIGQLTELIELYLGSHNDYNILPDDPSMALKQSLSERSRNRMANHKAYLSMIHPKTQFSEPIARAMKEKNVSIPEIALYEKYTEKQIIDPKTGDQLIIRPYDNLHGKLSNRLRSIDDAIGNLKKLEYLYIANSTIEQLPETLDQLVSLTDFEVYNCPKMTQFPTVITRIPSLISVNIANNKQWSSEEIEKGLKALAEGASRQKIQIFYCRSNNIKELPAELSQMTALGLIDFADNQISKLHPLGKDVSPVQIYLDYNQLESIPAGDDGLFCLTNDVESISITHNKLKKVPNIFTSKTAYVMKSVDLSYNDIDGFEGEDQMDGADAYRGISVQTLTLAANPKITKFPLALAQSNSQVAYINLRACNVDEIPEGSFKGKRSEQMVSIDLSYNNLSKLPNEWSAQTLPYLYGVELSYNRFSVFPFNPLNSESLTVYAVRGQRDELGNRCLRDWPTGLYQHKGLRGFYIGSNDLQKINDTISYLIYFLDISDNPGITFNAKDICNYWRANLYNLIYDKTQNIINCDQMLK